MGVLFAINAVICALQEGWTSLSLLLLRLLREATYTIKVSCPASRTVATNFFFPTSLTCLVIGKAFSIV